MGLTRVKFRGAVSSQVPSRVGVPFEVDRGGGDPLVRGRGQVHFAHGLGAQLSAVGEFESPRGVGLGLDAGLDQVPQGLHPVRAADGLQRVGGEGHVELLGHLELGRHGRGAVLLLRRVVADGRRVPAPHLLHPVPRLALGPEVPHRGLAGKARPQDPSHQLRSGAPRLLELQLRQVRCGASSVIQEPRVAAQAEEYAHDLGRVLALPCRHVQSGPPAGALLLQGPRSVAFGVSASVVDGTRLHRFDVSVERGEVERGEPNLVALARIRAACKEPL